MSDLNEWSEVEFSGIDLGKGDWCAISYSCADIDSAAKLVLRLEELKLRAPEVFKYATWVQYPGGSWRVK